MESSIAEFLMGQLAPEQLPTSARLRTRCESFGTCARALPPSPTEGTALWSAAPTITRRPLRRWNQTRRETAPLLLH